MEARKEVCRNRYIFWAGSHRLLHLACLYEAHQFIYFKLRRNVRREGFESITFFEIFISLIRAGNYATFGRLATVCRQQIFSRCLAIEWWLLPRKPFSIYPKMLLPPRHKCFLIFQRWKQQKKKHANIRTYISEKSAFIIDIMNKMK